MSNTDDGTYASELTRRVAEVLLADRLTPVPAGEKGDLPNVSVPESELRAKEGIYGKPAPGDFVRAFVRDGKLVLDTAAGEAPLTPASASRFVIAATPIVVDFLPEGSALPRELRVTGAGTEAGSPRPARTLRAFARRPAGVCRRLFQPGHRHDVRRCCDGQRARDPPSRQAGHQARTGFQRLVQWARGAVVHAGRTRCRDRLRPFIRRRAAPALRSGPALTGQQSSVPSPLCSSSRRCRSTILSSLCVVLIGTLELRVTRRAMLITPQVASGSNPNHPP